MEPIIAEYDSQIYEKSALIKAAYSFINEYYIHLEINDKENYYISFTAKSEKSAPQIIERFENELLAQTVRQYVYRETKSLREIMVARAMASSMIIDEDVTEITDNHSDCDQETNYNLNDILTDWFKHEN